MCHLCRTQALAGAEEATNALLFSLKWLMINLDREQHKPLGLPASSRPESHAGQFIELTRRSAVAEAASEQPCEDQKREVLGLGATGSKVCAKTDADPQSPGAMVEFEISFVSDSISDDGTDKDEPCSAAGPPHQSALDDDDSKARDGHANGCPGATAASLETDASPQPNGIGACIASLRRRMQDNHTKVAWLEEQLAAMGAASIVHKSVVSMPQALRGE